MQTQRDRLNAYQFLMGRMSSALVLGDSSRLEIPDRRPSLGVMYSIGLTVLIGIGCFLYGLIVPGNDTSWQTKGAIVVEKESGTRFVNKAGVLHPVRNHASALLIQGSDAHVEMVSGDSLKDARRGTPVGISDAPQTVPTPEKLSGGPWFLCPMGTDQAEMSMRVGGGAAPLGGQYALVADDDGNRYVLWQNRKHRLADETVAVALGIPNDPPPVAPDAWLDKVPDGKPLAPADIPGAGDPGSAVGGQKYPIGSVFQQRPGNGQDRTYVLRKDGLAQISATEFALLAASSDQPPVDVSASDVVTAKASSDTSLVGRLPDLDGKRSTDSGQACLLQQPSKTEVSSMVVTSADAGSSMSSTGAEMPPGSGMLAAKIPAPQEGKPVRYLIDDQGRKYRLAGDDTVSALGFSGIPPTPVDESVLALLPSGPDLSRASVGAAQEG